MTIHRHHLTHVAAVAAGALIASAAFLYAPSPAALELPDAKQTPGAILPVASAEVCVAGYAGKTRHVTEKTKREVCRRYGLKFPLPHGRYEYDHLCSLELGGSNEPDNIWPQPYFGLWNAHLKDRLENKMHELVCDGTLTLAEAQTEIRTDWIDAYERYVSH